MFNFQEEDILISIHNNNGELTMIKLISQNQFGDLSETLPINYDEYSAWQHDEPVKGIYYVIGTNNVDIRPRNEWNSKGREIFNKNKLYEHAKKIIRILEENDLKRFVIRHYYSFSKWFENRFINEKLAQEQINYLKYYCSEFEPESFDGAFLLEEGIRDFIENFIAYPYLWKHSDIEIISTEQKLILTLNHHLSVNFTSNSKKILKNIIAMCDKIQLNYVKGDNTELL